MKKFILPSIFKNSINKLKCNIIRRKTFIKKSIVPIMGLIALIWFLVRVIPKPSRAFYPCQRAAFPLASAFVIWIITFAVSFLSFKKARKLFTETKYFAAVAFFGIALVTFLIMQISGGYRIALAQSTGNGFATIPLINDPDSAKAVVAPKGVVGIVQSPIAAKNLTAAEIDTMVRQAIDLAGGFDSTLIKDGQTVVLKPNLVRTFNSDPSKRTSYRLEGNSGCSEIGAYIKSSW